MTIANKDVTVHNGDPDRYIGIGQRSGFSR